MKFLFVLFFVLQGVYARCQNLKLPFQIIFSEGVVNRSGKLTKSLDLIGADEKLTIQRDGILSMIHYSGVPVEVTGDTIINVGELLAGFDLLLKSVQKKDYRVKRSDIHYLFIDGYDRAMRSRDRRTGAVDRNWQRTDLLYPPRSNGLPIFVTRDLCVRWRATDSRVYTIEFKSLFDDVFATREVHATELNIPAAEMDSIWGNEIVLVLAIRDEKGEICNQLLRRVPDEFKDYPFGCRLDKATYALVVALYVEKSLIERDASAEQYFKLAAKLSNHQFFKTMLDNFYKRWSR